MSEEENLTNKWQHPRGKLREEGADSLIDQELLAILLYTGIKGKPAEKIAEEILVRFGSLKGLANQPLEKLLEIKGLSDVKVILVQSGSQIAFESALAREA